MKKKIPDVSLTFKSPAPSEQEISDYAFFIYEKGNREHGHDVEHWQQASACLLAGTSCATALV